MKKYTSNLLILSAMLVMGCASSKTVTKEGEIAKTWEQEQIHRNYIEVRGIGAADQSLKNTTQRRAISREAAIIDAQTKILEIIKGLEIEGEATVSKALLTDHELNKKVQGAIKGALELKTEWTSDDGCVVTMRLDKRVLKKIDQRFKI